MTDKWIIETYRRDNGALILRTEYKDESVAKEEYARCQRHFNSDQRIARRMAARLLYWPAEGVLDAAALNMIQQHRDFWMGKKDEFAEYFKPRTNQEDWKL